MEGGIMTAVQTSNPVHDAEGAVEAGIHEVGATIDAVEREVGRGVSTRFPLNSAFIFTFGALGGMLFGFDTGIISGASPLIESDFGLSVAQTGFITSSVLIGSCAGALSIGALSDRFGRKKLLILAAILFLLGSGMCAGSTGFLMMVVARTGKLLGAGKARRARPHDGHTPSGPHGRRLGPHPALAPGAVDDGALDRADADGRVVEKVPRAARLADRGTDPARELGKGVRRREARPGALPVAFAHEAVPVDGTVVKRTVVRAERGAAVQAAQALRMNLVVVERDREVPEALDAFLDREMAEFDALVFRHGNLL